METTKLYTVIFLYGSADPAVPLFYLKKIDKRACTIQFKDLSHACDKLGDLNTIEPRAIAKAKRYLKNPSKDPVLASIQVRKILAQGLKVYSLSEPEKKQLEMLVEQPQAFDQTLAEILTLKVSRENGG